MNLTRLCVASQVPGTGVILSLFLEFGVLGRKGKGRVGLTLFEVRMVFESTSTLNPSPSPKNNETKAKTNEATYANTRPKTGRKTDTDREGEIEAGEASQQEKVTTTATKSDTVSMSTVVRSCTVMYAHATQEHDMIREAG